MGFLSMLAIGAIPCLVFFVFVKKRRSQMLKTCGIEKLLRGKVVLITGSNCGLGRQLAYELAKREATVVLACRNMQKANEAIRWISDKIVGSSGQKTPIDLHALQLDLASLVSVKNFVQEFLGKFSKLHILVNNAGVMGGPFGLTQSGVETAFGVNHLGHFHLTNLLLDCLKKSAPSRIVIISSGYYRKMKTADFDQLKSDVGYQPLQAYARSKLANCLHAISLNEQLTDKQVDVFVVRPGFVRGTQLGRHFSRIQTTLFYPMIWFMSKNLDEGVQTMLYCCLEDNLKSGVVYDNCQEDRMPVDLLNKDNAKALWDLSEKLVKEGLAIETVAKD